VTVTAPTRPGTGREAPFAARANDVWKVYGSGEAEVVALRGVSVELERGAFTASDSDAVTHVLRFGLLQLPFYFAGLVLVQWIAANSRYQVLLAAACLALATKILMNLLLIPHFGLAGIMAATAGMYAVSLAFQYFVVVRNHD